MIGKDGIKPVPLKVLGVKEFLPRTNKNRKQFLDFRFLDKILQTVYIKVFYNR